MKLPRRRWIVLGLIVVGLVAWYASRATHRPDPAAAFTTQVIGTGDLAEAITANGVINPVRVVSVGTQVSGTVAKLNVDYNSRVVVGQILCELDPSVYAARVAASEAALANIRSTLALTRANTARAAELFKQNYISRQDYETTAQTAASATAQVAAAEAQVKQDRTNLGYTIIRSPVSGVIISRQVDLGQTVAASFTTPVLFTIARDLAAMQIDAAVAEADVAKVRIGQPVSFTVDAFGARTFTGTVKQIRLNPTTQSNVVTYTVIVGVANPDGALLPGMTANASFLVANHADVLLIPNAALSYKPADYKPAKRQASDAGTMTVFVLVGSTPEARRIRLGASDADNSIVTGGDLHAGDKIITEDKSKVLQESALGAPPAKT